MLTPAGLGQVCQALCGDCQAAQGLFLSWKDGLTSLKQQPSQGLLIPSPAADHVNPDLSERAACPGAANPPAYRGGRDARCLSSPRLAGRACVQRSGQQASTLGRRHSALQLLFTIVSRATHVMYMQLLQEEKVRGGRPASCVSPALPGALVSTFVKGQGNLYLGTK